MLTEAEWAAAAAWAWAFAWIVGRDVRRPEEAVAIEVLLGRRWLEREPEAG